MKNVFIRLLIQAGAEVDCQDYDGWTPLHAAAYWGQKEACEILVEHFCNMKKKNFVVICYFKYFRCMKITSILSYICYRVKQHLMFLMKK